MRRSHYLVTASFAALLVLGGFLLARTPLPSRVKSLPSQVAQTAAQLTAEPESIPTDAIAQRYRAKHEAINAMRRDLARLVALESTHVADSGRPTGFLSMFQFPVAPGSRLISFELRPGAWNATMMSDYTPIQCTVSVRIAADSRTSLADSVVCARAHSPVP
jgi:hypothetical protein